MGELHARIEELEEELEAERAARASLKKPVLILVENSKNSPNVSKKVMFKLKLKWRSTKDVKLNFSSFNAILKNIPFLMKPICLHFVRSMLILLLNFPNQSKTFKESNLNSRRKNPK